MVEEEGGEAETGGGVVEIRVEPEDGACQAAEEASEGERELGREGIAAEGEDADEESGEEGDEESGEGAVGGEGVGFEVEEAAGGMEGEEGEEFRDGEARGAGHAGSGGAEEADDEGSGEAFDHDAGVGDGGIESEFGPVIERPEGDPEDAPCGSGEEEEAERFRGEPRPEGGGARGGGAAVGAGGELVHGWRAGREISSAENRSSRLRRPETWHLRQALPRRMLPAKRRRPSATELNSDFPAVMAARA